MRNTIYKKRNRRQFIRNKNNRNIKFLRQKFLPSQFPRSAPSLPSRRCLVIRNEQLKRRPNRQSKKMNRIWYVVIPKGRKRNVNTPLRNRTTAQLMIRRGRKRRQKSSLVKGTSRNRFYLLVNREIMRGTLYMNRRSLNLSTLAQIRHLIATSLNRLRILVQRLVTT